MEVKNLDGAYQEAVINKLTDASWYTVGKGINLLKIFSKIIQRKQSFLDLLLCLNPVDVITVNGFYLTRYLKNVFH